MVVHDVVYEWLLVWRLALLVKIHEPRVDDLCRIDRYVDLVTAVLDLKWSELRCTLRSPLVCELL